MGRADVIVMDRDPAAARPHPPVTARPPSAMTVRDVAGYLNVDEKTVYRLVQRKELPGFKVAGAWRFRLEEIDGWIEAAREGSTVRPRGATRMRALVVEDDDVDRMALRRAIRDSDPLGAVEVVEVSTLEQARAALSAEKWDCVVVDRRLPDGDGISLIEGERELVGNAAVVVLTGLDDEEIARAALRNGAQDYLIKGRIDGQILLRSLRYAIERKRFEDQRRVSEANFRGLIEHSPDAICVFRSRVVVYANPAFARLVGSPSCESLLGREAGALIHPDDDARLPYLGAVTTAAVESEPLRESRLRGASGGWVVAEAWTNRVVFDEADAVLLACRDISRRKQLEEQVVFSSRMAAVGTLAAGVAHELNNPLACVIGNLEFALEGLTELAARLTDAPAGEQIRKLTAIAAEGREALGEARHGAARVRCIIRDLKALARPPGRSEDTAPLQQVVEWAIGVVAPELHARARLVRDYRAAPVVMGSDRTLGQMVINLLINAAHAIPAGNPDGNQIEIGIGSAADGRAVLSVRDTGSGITREHLPRIFDPFFTTKPVGSGTGLGLAVCHGIVTALGGTITVQSEVGRGTTFQVHLLPTRAATAQATVAPVVVPGGEPRRRGRILIVDDDHLVATSLARGLSRSHDVTVVHTGKEALARLAAGPSYDVILCDLMMPEVSGMDLHQRLARDAPEVVRRIIFVTGGAFTPHTQQFLDTVPNLRLEKPMDPAALAALVRDRVDSLPVP
jgi:PAS domain S-box-containing protein/excisionase family DNA binding protein